MTRADNDPEQAVPAAQWRSLRLALGERLDRLIDRRNESTDPAEVVALHKQIEETRAQVRTLAVEESVAQFVEDAERYVVAANTIGSDFDLNRDPDTEIA